RAWRGRDRFHGFLRDGARGDTVRVESEPAAVEHGTVRQEPAEDERDSVDDGGGHSGDEELSGYGGTQQRLYVYFLGSEAGSGQQCFESGGEEQGSLSGWPVDDSALQSGGGRGDPAWAQRRCNGHVNGQRGRDGAGVQY